MIDFEWQPQLPSLQSEAKDWSFAEGCVFASQLYNSIYYAVTMGLIRELGHERTYEIHARLLRHHQEHFFLEGLRKLRLDQEISDAVRCAKYHWMSNAIGGVRTGCVVQSPSKAWMFYFPHTPDNAWPGQSVIVHTKANMLSDYIGWHGNNGKLLGNPGLRYVATHFVCEGDPYDGGYFEDTGRVLHPDELVIERPGERPPSSLPIQTCRLDESQWPPQRRSRALRNYAVTWAADRVWSVLHECEPACDAIPRKAIQAVLFSWMPRFRAAFAQEQPRGGREELAAYLAGFHCVAGIDARVDHASDVTRVVLDRTLVDFVGGSVSPRQARRFADVVVGAWKTIAEGFGVELLGDDAGRIWSLQARRAG